MGNGATTLPIEIAPIKIYIPQRNLKFLKTKIKRGGGSMLEKEIDERYNHFKFVDGLKTFHFWNVFPCPSLKVKSSQPFNISKICVRKLKNKRDVVFEEKS